MNDQDPVIDAWYIPYDNGQPFAVVMTDEDANFIEIQYFNGEFDELTYDDWQRLDVEPCEAPESWSGALETLQADDVDLDELQISELDEANEGGY